MTPADTKPEDNPNLFHRLINIDDGRLMRGIFFCLFAAVCWTLYTDFKALHLEDSAESVQPGMVQPILPPFIPPSPNGEPQTEAPNIRPAVTTNPNLLREPLKIHLSGKGVLKLIGTVDVGSAERFSQQITDLIEYVKVIDLNSPGGSVADALAISAKIRKHKFETRVEDGALCASSCPIIFAGGIQRISGAKAAIGVHQVYSRVTGERSADLEVSQTQTTTAKIKRHLTAMGVDSNVWLHALDTPPRQLYYLNVEELERYKLATKILTPKS